MAIKQELVAQAESQLAQYPQYEGHWDDWTVGLVKRDIKTKAGLAFRKGDAVLVQPIIRDLTESSFAKRKNKLGVTAYSFRNRCDTGLWLDDIAIVEPGALETFRRVSGY